MPLPRIVALTLATASWVAALLLLLGDTSIGRVGAWLFFAAKGLVILLTLLAMLRNIIPTKT